MGQVRQHTVLGKYMQHLIREEEQKAVARIDGGDFTRQIANEIDALLMDALYALYEGGGESGREEARKCLIRAHGLVSEAAMIERVQS